MKTLNPVFLAVLCMVLFIVKIHAQSEPFLITELNQKPAGAAKFRIAHPFEIIYGPDNYLYITEKLGRVLRVDTGTGVRQVILDHRASVHLNITRNGSGVATGIGQNGMMGMALHPNFLKGTGQDSIFIAYSNTSTSVRISRFKYNGGATPSLTNETILLTGLPTGGDHSTGRLIIGPDNKLYYACGDIGANQFANRCSIIRSQNDPTSTQVGASNFTNYAGKILRIEFNGSIPSDNPTFNSVRSHVYSKGHRNPQGLVFQKVESNGSAYPSMVVNGRLYSSEHGPRTDDEVNIIESGKNYGWPYIAGDSDNVHYQYVNWNSSSSCASTSYTENAIPSGAVITQEKDAPASVKTDFRKPILNMHSTCGTQTTSTCDAGGTNWMKFATVAPSSVDYYNIKYGIAIPGWYPSLLIPTLRKGVVYRVKLNATGDAAVSDTIPIFSSFNRYRDIALSPDGLKIFVVTDSVGSTSGPSGGGTSTLANPGSIMVYHYTGATLALRDNRTNRAVQYNVNIYPNPAREVLNIEVDKGLHKPLRYFLYDVMGKGVLQGSTTKNTFSVDVSHIRRGIYIVKIVDGYGMDVVLEKVILR